MQIVVATTNRHKFREFRTHFAAFDEIELLSLLDFPEYVQPAECGQTFEENAILKATHAAAFLEAFVLADDSGLVVPALKGAPGIYSRRYAGEHATDLENRRKLLKEMASLDDLGRSAHYECSLAFASPEGLQKCVSSMCHGSIATQEKGSNGFGYDALFVKHDYNQTFAQLGEHIKKEVSHRAKALERLSPYIESLVEQLTS